MYRAATTGVGEYVAAERHAAWPGLPSEPKPRGVVLHHGVGWTALQQIGTVRVDDTVAELNEKGIDVITGDFAGAQTWGNATGQLRLQQLWDFQKSRYGAKSDKVVLYGISHGATVVLNWAWRNPTKVAAIVLLIPAISVDDMHDRNVLGLAASIETAYGGAAAYETQKADFDPLPNAARLMGLPMLAYYSNDDTYCLPALTQQWAVAAGAQAVNLGNVGGHGAILSASQYVTARQFMATAARG